MNIHIYIYMNMYRVILQKLEMRKIVSSAYLLACRCLFVFISNNSIVLLLLAIRYMRVLLSAKYRT